MKTQHVHTGFAVAIAWPETYCKQPGSWYDPLMSVFGINRNNYYKVGHAALCLINAQNGETHYFDFGRYHAPFQYGRVRGANTDPELKLSTRANVDSSSDKITNLSAILTELQNNTACHGEGALHAAYCTINFRKTFIKVRQMQEATFIPYGPFIHKGSNCSRFVNTAILAGNPNLNQILKLRYKVPFTPTPMSNVNALKHYKIVPKTLNTAPFQPNSPLSIIAQKTVLLQKERPNNIPTNAQWLAGEGAGSWYSFKRKGNSLTIGRYSPNGILESEDLYNIPLHTTFNFENCKITYPTNLQIVTLIATNQEISLSRQA